MWCLEGKMLKEFKKFAMRGNVIDMAVGIIIGAAFSKIVNSLVSDVLMPPLGLLIGKVDFTNLFITLRSGSVPGPYETLAAANAAGAVTINIGLFINAIVSFIIVAFAIFMLIKFINKIAELDKKKEEAAAAPTTKVCPECASQIPVQAKRCPNCTSVLETK